MGASSAWPETLSTLQRWPDGLQAAVEAKEALAASESGEILDSITVESLVRRYPRVCGMTGTAVTVGEQLRQFYGLEVAVIPPNRPLRPPESSPAPWLEGGFAFPPRRGRRSARG